MPVRLDPITGVSYPGKGEQDTQVEIGVVPETTQPTLFTLLPDWLWRAKPRRSNPSKPDDHSESVPPLPIPNRTVKRLYADDSADSRVKVGNRQAPQQ